MKSIMKVLNVLIVDDSKIDAEFILNELIKMDYLIEHGLVDNDLDMRRLLSEKCWDIVLCDYSMPGFDPFKALNILKEIDLDIPFIVISGTIGDEKVVSLLKAGCHDCIIKDNMTRLPGVINRELKEATVRRENLAIKKQLVTESKETVERINRTLEGTIETLALVVEVRDPYTSGHQKRVADIAVAIAECLSLPSSQVRGLYLASIIHDLGKIQIPSEILSKPGKLTTIEYEFIKCHPEIAYNLLKGIDFPWPIAEIVYQHHEKINGSGYPRNLKDDSILLEAKIIGIADVIDAMTSHRPYRPALGLDIALDEIRKNKDILYDSTIVDVLLDIVVKGEKLKDILFY